MCSELIFPFEFPNEKGNYKLIWQFSFHIDRFRELVGTSSLLGDESCWRMACNQEKPSCQYDFFDCHHVQDPARVSWYGSTNVTSLCNGTSTNSPIQFGIYAVAMTNSLSSCKFFSKFLYCLWWGINNLRYALGC